jgi:7-cyano-7-deazaguanine synthase
MKTVVVLSGGMDSTTALAWAKNRGHEIVACLHFQYGSKHNHKELVAVSAIADHYDLRGKTHVVELPLGSFKSDLLTSGGPIPEGHYADESMKRTVVPFRNGIMLAIAAGFAESIEAKAVVLGNHFGDHAIYPDCRAEFAAAMREAIKLGTYAQIELHSPFQEFTKTDIARIGASICVPFEKTWTCYKGGEKHCGKCGSCSERREAFQLAGVPDPTEYEV